MSKFAAYVDPSLWADHGGGALAKTRDGERASRDTPCVCGLALREHSPHWPHDSIRCNGFQQKPGTDRTRPEVRPKRLRLPPLPATLDRSAISKVKPAVTRAELLDALRGYSSPRTARCRSKRVSGSVQIHRQGDRVSILGLETCGSVWACPCCAARIYARRASELGQAFDLWQSSEPTMVTLTVRHNAGDELERLRRGLAKAWEFLWRGRAGMARRKAWGLRHWVRAVEVSHGPNGWHPHIHAFVFAMNPLTLESTKRELAHAWRRAVVRALGFKFRPSVRRGVDVRPRGCARMYLAKMGLEIHAITKGGRKPGHRSPWQIAQDAARGDRRAASLWQTYVRSMHGARQLTWSRGAKVRFGLKDVSDDEAAREDGEVSALLVRWTGEAWDRHRWAPGWLARVVRAAHAELPVTELSKLPGATATGPPGSVKRPDACDTEPIRFPVTVGDGRRDHTSPAAEPAAG